MREELEIVRDLLNVGLMSTQQLQWQKKRVKSFWETVWSGRFSRTMKMLNEIWEQQAEVSSITRTISWCSWRKTFFLLLGNDQLKKKKRLLNISERETWTHKGCFIFWSVWFEASRRISGWFHLTSTSSFSNSDLNVNVCSCDLNLRHRTCTEASCDKPLTYWMLMYLGTEVESEVIFAIAWSWTKVSSSRVYVLKSVDVSCWSLRQTTDGCTRSCRKTGKTPRRRTSSLWDTSHLFVSLFTNTKCLGSLQKKVE